MTNNELDKIIESIDRPFLNEMDFQLWLLRKLESDYPGSIVVPEYPYHNDIKKKKSYIDIFVKKDGIKYGIELKYKTKAEEVNIGDYFKGDLKDHGAHPINRYSYLRDIYRLEYAVEKNIIDKGFTILLSNDATIWNGTENESLSDGLFRFKKSDGTPKTIPNRILLNFKGNEKGEKYPILNLKGTYEVKMEELKSPKLKTEYPEFKYFYSINEINSNK